MIRSLTLSVNARNSRVANVCRHHADTSWRVSPSACRQEKRVNSASYATAESVSPSVSSRNPSMTTLSPVSRNGSSVGKVANGETRCALTPLPNLPLVVANRVLAVARHLRPEGGFSLPRLRLSGALTCGMCLPLNFTDQPASSPGCRRVRARRAVHGLRASPTMGRHPFPTHGTSETAGWSDRRASGQAAALALSCLRTVQGRSHPALLARLARPETDPSRSDEPLVQPKEVALPQFEGTTHVQAC
jgi:hypothetical protein